MWHSMSHMLHTKYYANANYVTSSTSSNPNNKWVIINTKNIRENINITIKFITFNKREYFLPDGGSEPLKHSA